jgi:hypothetical protein
MVSQVKTPEQMERIAEDLLLAYGLVVEEFERQFPVEFRLWEAKTDELEAM